MAIPKKITPLVTGASVVVLIGAAAAGGLLLGSQQSDVAPRARQDPSLLPAQPSDNEPRMFKDGQYTANGEYITPGGTESVRVTIRLEDATITEVELIPSATKGTAVEFQGKFSSNYRPLVIGKKISDLKLNRVAGSSLTPNGFNRAIQQIKKDAGV